MIFRGAVFADNARFDRCLQLWVHALRLKQMNKVCVMKDLLRFAQVSSEKKKEREKKGSAEENGN